MHTIDTAEKPLSPEQRVGTVRWRVLRSSNNMRHEREPSPCLNRGSCASCTWASTHCSPYCWNIEYVGDYIAQNIRVVCWAQMHPLPSSGFPPRSTTLPLPPSFQMFLCAQLAWFLADLHPNIDDCFFNLCFGLRSHRR